MKIYKISQQEAIENQEQTIETVQNLTNAMNTLNESLKAIEQSNILSLFNRTQLSASIQSGNIAQVNAGDEEELSQAVHNIVLAIPVIIECENFLQASKINYDNIKMGMTEIIQSDSWTTYNEAVSFIYDLMNYP